MELLIDVPRIEPAPFDIAARKYPALVPRVIGRLRGVEAQHFSDPLRCDVRGNPSSSTGTNGSVSVKLTIERHANGSQYCYEIPDALEQFAPAIRQIAAFEHGRYPHALPDRASLLIRQSLVRRHMSQQPGFNQGEAHRDNRLGTRNRHYVIADRVPTAFYNEPSGPPPVNYAPVFELELAVAGAPYDIVGAATSVLHRSPEVMEEQLRTFMRASYEYAS